MTSDTISGDAEPLHNLLYACQRGQRVAIVGSHTDDDPLRNQLYVEQKEDDIVNRFFEEEYTKDGQLLILTGSAGDGKSALLARGFSLVDEDLPKSRINMDATEARQKDGDYADRLTSFFEEVLDDVRSETGHRSALAINYGLAVDYFERRGAPEEFSIVWEALQESQSKPVHEPDDLNIGVINLSHRRTYETHPDKIGEGLVRDLLDRFDPTNDSSPFSEAYDREKSECPAGDDCILHYNVRQLGRTEVKDNIARVLAGWSVVTGSYLNPRTIIDDIASFLLPSDLQDLPDHEICPVGAAIEEDNLDASEEDLIWNAVFRTIKTERDRDASSIDPASYTSFSTDQEVLGWGADVGGLDDALASIPDIALTSLKGKVRTRLRRQYLTGEEGETILDDQTFEEFLAALTYFGEDGTFAELENKTKAFLNTTKAALSSWTGRQRSDGLVEFVDGQRSPDYRYLSKWNEPSFDTDQSISETRSLAVPGRVKLMAQPPPDTTSNVPVPLSFETYRLMNEVSQGYTPNATDLNRSHAIRMLHSRLDDFTEKRRLIIIEDQTGTRKVTVKEGDIGISVEQEGVE